MVNINFRTASSLLIAFIFGVLFTTNIAGCDSATSAKNKQHRVQYPTSVLSLSTDGRYAVASTYHKHLILWDLKKHISKTISTDANIYSAYFIHHSNMFMWQDIKKNEVHIENTDGSTIKHFISPFASYGEVITENLSTYIASDSAWNLYKIHEGKVNNIKPAYNGSDFAGSGKLFNLTLSDDGKILLTVGMPEGYGKLPISVGKNAKDARDKGYDVGLHNTSLYNGVTLWDVKSGLPITKFSGNVAKTYGTLSPDGKYAIACDENNNVFLWNSKTGKKISRLWDIIYGKAIAWERDGSVWRSTTKGLIKLPKGFKGLNGENIDEYTAIKFVDETHFLTFHEGVPYAVLYSIEDPRPIKYLYLGKNPYPTIFSFYLPHTFFLVKHTIFLHL